MEYTRDLGYCAAQFLLDGGNGAMVSIVNGRFTPLPFKDMVDSATGRTRVRMVDIESESYKIARAYMARLEQEDLANMETVSQYAEILNMTPEQFLESFKGASDR
jgi:6-phosphofructokinase 1